MRDHSNELFFEGEDDEINEDEQFGYVALLDYEARERDLLNQQ